MLANQTEPDRFRDFYGFEGEPALTKPYGEVNQLLKLLRKAIRFYKDRKNLEKLCGPALFLFFFFFLALWVSNLFLFLIGLLF